VRTIPLPQYRKQATALLLLSLLCILPRMSFGHAFPDHAEPKVGSTVAIAPRNVRIWFDGDLETVFSTIVVHDAKGGRVDSGDGRVDPADPTLLEVSLPPLRAGTYRVLWNVAARDGHRTQGEFTFTVK
jgi:methionine-rich copper-binding protein CopC